MKRDDMTPMLPDNLAEMEWVLPVHAMPDGERGAFAARIMAETAEDYRNGQDPPQAEPEETGERMAARPRTGPGRAADKIGRT
jgi:hypothetical protein